MMVGVEGVAAFDANGFARLVKQLGPKGDVVARPAVIDLHAIKTIGNNGECCHFG